MKIAVVGGVAAGTSAAARARRKKKDAEIVIFEKDNEISYAGCGLPYYISGTVEGREKIVINTPAQFEDKYGVEVKIRHQVTDINPEDKILTYQNLEQGNTGTYQYDKLILATGAAPTSLSLPGADLEGVVNLRTVGDADRIKEYIRKNDIEKTVIIGGGLVGLEMAEAFQKLGLEVTVVELLPQVLVSFSKEMAGIVEDHLREKGVRLFLGEGVKEFIGDKVVEGVVTENGEELFADLVLVAAGIKPRTGLACDAGIKLGETGAIKVNEKMETSRKDIYAAGDCAESKMLSTGDPVWVPLGSTANKQGRVAGTNVVGGEGRHCGVLKTTINKIFSLTVARTGLEKEEAAEAGFKPVEIKITAASHAGYYPGREMIHLKGIFARKSGRLLGAEIVGKKGVDKRLDVLSTAIYGEQTAEDLFQLDLGYAPPYSTPKDPVAILGMVAEKKVRYYYI
ncbi:MAG: FAD-dependent oxidoreductase [Halanaerobiaceae bacterium]